jgi:hypothetical protein
MILASLAARAAFRYGLTELGKKIVHYVIEDAVSQLGGNPAT